MRAWAKALGLAVALLPGVAGAQMAELVSQSAFRVCADPANDPMSTEAGTGFENRIADLLAAELERPVEYSWFPMATGFVRRTLGEKRCDVIIGFAQGHELVQNTNHYMTSVYTLILPKTGELSDVVTLADPRLKGKVLGIVAGSPPGTHMARNGLMAKARAYPLFVDRRVQSPASDMLRDLEAGEIDAAVLWGPIGGPLVKREHPDLQVVPLLHEVGAPKMFYRITMGVRLGEDQWKRELNSLIRRNQAEIDAILNDAGVPLLNDMGTEAKVLSQ
ncbi:Bacterial extracellular solute-binding protein, family 3 [Roseovarius sp. EC-HK134]|uniref:substrate-binding domain-containing protein n=1 Tax=unclassified Roseovarius TaxID=2614913 RepID=UPI001252D30B|nr:MULTISPECIES: substrate-binding domain-containing protein [unclassified Roseovarius]VVT16560.1 Bacterial extracellular solute-binding protein, family 3 [Roseovarius sp. EC-HK134]VVT17051.1 Bacterial extracellular solute-binding protein, family 3 [Roseovarius sp. EC-SD190]